MSESPVTDALEKQGAKDVHESWPEAISQFCKAVATARELERELSRLKAGFIKADCPRCFLSMYLPKAGLGLIPSIAEVAEKEQDMREQLDAAADTFMNAMCKAPITQEGDLERRIEECLKLTRVLSDDILRNLLGDVLAHLREHD